MGGEEARQQHPSSALESPIHAGQVDKQHGRQRGKRCKQKPRKAGQLAVVQACGPAHTPQQRVACQPPQRARFCAEQACMGEWQQARASS